MALDNLKITSYEDGVSELPDNPSDAGFTAAELKRIFDARSDNEIKEQHNALVDEVATHESGENPHGITKKTVGLSNVDNTSDADKPVSTAQREAIDMAKDEAVEAALDKISVIEGPPGADGISCTHSWNGTILTIGSASGVSSVDLKGDKGDKGEQGVQGIQGMKGDKGDTGTIGPQGETGAAGADGQDGGYYIPEATQIDEITVQVVYTKSKESMPDIPEVNIVLPQGLDGYTPVRGTDYWTEADKAEIKSYVEDAILGGAW